MSKSEWRVAIYLRVSTDKQDAANQLPELHRLAQARGWCADVTEETESGAKKRPKLDALCDAACKGHYSAVVVWSLDRLGRNLWEVVARVRRLQVANVRVVSLREPWLEQEGPARDLLLFIFSWVAEQERRRLIERTHAGLAKARAAGRIGGRPRAATAALSAAAKECERRGSGRWRQWQGKSGQRLPDIAARHGLSESTLRRFLRSVRLELEPVDQVSAVKKGR